MKRSLSEVASAVRRIGLLDSQGELSQAVLVKQKIWRAARLRN